MTRAALALLLVLAAACGTTVTKEQADFACVNFSTAIEVGHGVIDPTQFTHEQIEKQFGLGPPEAAEILRQAVHNYCPQFERML